MRRLVLTLIAVVAVLAIGLFAFLSLFDMDRFRPQISAQISKALNRNVTMSKLSLRVFPFSVRMDDFAVSEAAPFPQDKPFASARQVFANASLLSIIRGAPRVQSLEMQQPRIQLIRDTGGVWNFSSLGKGTNSSDSNSSFTLDNLAIHDGLLSVADLRTSPERSTYDHIDFTVKDFGPGKQFPVTLSAHLPGSGKESIRLDANAGPINKTLSLTPINGKIAMEEVSLADLAGKSNATEGSASGNASLQSENGNLKLNGQVTLQNAKVNGVAIAFPVRADFNVTGDLQKELFQLQPLKLQLGNTPMEVNGYYDSGKTPPAVSLQVATSNTSIAEVAKLGAAFGAGEGVNATGNASISIKLVGPVNAVNYSGTAAITGGSVQADALTKPVQIHNATLAFERSTNNGALRETASAQNMDVAVGSTTLRGNASVQNFDVPTMSFTLHADKLDLTELQGMVKPSHEKETHQASVFSRASGTGTVDAATVVASGITMTNVHTGISFGHDTVQLSPFTAQLFGGQSTGTIGADLRPASPAISVQANLSHIDANQLLSAVSTTKNTIFGNLAAKTNLQFTVPQNNELIHTLNGSLGFDLANGEIRNLDLMKELGKIARFTGAALPAGETTPLKRLSGDLLFANGVAKTSNLTAQIPQGSVAAVGTANLGSGALDMKLTAVLATAISKAMGGSSIGGIMQTALANRKGELVIPAVLRGTMSKPMVEPDVAAVTKMQMQNLLPTSGNPAALTSGLLGAITGGKGASGSKAQEILDAVTGQSGAKNNNAGGIVGGILNGLTQPRKQEKKQ